MKPRAEEVLASHNMEDLARYEFVSLRYPRHIDYDPETGEVVAIVCRGCGAKIAGWVDDDVYEQQVDKVNVNSIVTKLLIRQKFRRLGNCTQLRLLLDNNALYEPLICRDCAKDINERFVQELYKADLIEMIAESMAKASDPDRAVRIVRHLAQRHVEVF